MSESKIKVPWETIDCPTCSAKAGEPCGRKSTPDGGGPCHMARHNRAKQRIPENVKEAILNTFCPTCRAIPGEPCRGSGGTWWHRGRDCMVLEQHSMPPSRATRVFMTACPRCDARPGEPCLTVDYMLKEKRKKNKMTKGEANSKSLLPKTKFHGMRTKVLLDKSPAEDQHFPLDAAYSVKCPQCGAGPDKKCVRTSENTDDGYRRLPSEEWTKPCKRPHWPRWRAAKQMYLEAHDPETAPKTPKLPDAKTVLDFEESCLETGLHAELVE